MYFSRVSFLVSCLTVSVSALPATGNLRSQLPAEPIEDPPSWAWGTHPRNALGYRAKDDHPLEVCLANPSLIKGAKCKIPLDICLENPEWLPLVGCSSKGYPLQVCLDYPQLLTSKACEGNQYPVKTCTSMPSLLTLKSCDFVFPLASCISNPQLLTIPQCLGNQYPVKTCTSNPALLTLKSCDFPFPLDTCTSQPDLFAFPQCSGNLTPEVCASTPSVTRTSACTAALVGYKATLFDCQDNKEILCSLNMCDAHAFLVKC